MGILDSHHRSKKPSIARHVYHKNSSREFNNIRLCRGILIYIDNTFIPVTFVFYESLEVATIAFNRYGRINHSGIVRCWSLSDDEGTEDTGYKGLGYYVVSFDKFACFLTQYPEAEKLFEAASNIPGIPNEWVRSVIKDLISAIKHLYSLGLNCGAFELPVAYVWVIDENHKVMSLKLFLVGESMDGYTPEMWRCLQDDGIYSFGLMLKNYILVQPSVMRDAFLEYFYVVYHPTDKLNTLCPMDRLCMIEEAPFLEVSIHNILRGISTAYMALERQTLPGYNTPNLKKALNNPKLFAEICSGGHWRVGITEEYKTYLKTQMAEEGKKINKVLDSENIEDTNLFNLLKWNSNPFQHGSFSEDSLYKEAFGRWDKLFSKVHLVMWQHKKTGRESVTAG